MEVFKSYIKENWDKHDLLRELRTEDNGVETEEEVPERNEDEFDDYDVIDVDDIAINEEVEKGNIFEKVFILLVFELFMPIKCQLLPTIHF